MLPKLFRCLALSALALAALPAAALEIEGQRFDDSIRLGNANLVANGGGLRSRVFFKVYVMALYLPEKKDDADAAINSVGPKRLAIVTMRELQATQLADALKSGIEKNHSEGEYRLLNGDVQQFLAGLTGLGEVKKGTPIQIDWLPEAGTRLTVAGKTVGKDIAGEAFYRALLRIWLGKSPAQDELKAGLLGKAPG